MTNFIIYVMLLAPPIVPGPSIEMQAEVIYGAFSTVAACNSFGEKRAADLQKTVPSKYRVQHRCEQLGITPKD